MLEAIDNIRLAVGHSPRLAGIVQVYMTMEKIFWLIRIKKIAKNLKTSMGAILYITQIICRRMGHQNIDLFFL